MTAAKTSAWTDDEGQAIVTQRKLDDRGAYETGPDGEPLVFHWTRETHAAERRVREEFAEVYRQMWACPDCYSTELHHRPGCER